MTKSRGFQKSEEMDMRITRIITCRFATIGATLSLFLTAGAVNAQAQCTQATLTGTYVNSGSGLNGSFPAATVGTVTYDGHGAGSSTSTTTVGGVASRSVVATGVYTVNADCTGSETFGGATAMDFVLTPDGREISWIVTNSGSGAGFTGHAVRTDSSGSLHITKECSQYTGQAGGFCTITSSNFAPIKVGTRIYYETDQTANFAAGFFSTDVYLDAGSGNMAVGHCTLNAASIGACTFSDGVGQFAGFHGRVAVTPFTSSPTEVNYHWEGSYRFAVEPGR